MGGGGRGGGGCHSISCTNINKIHASLKLLALFKILAFLHCHHSKYILFLDLPFCTL